MARVEDRNRRASPPPDLPDPFAPLAPVANLLGGAGGAIGGALGSLVNAPVLGGALQGLGAAYGESVLPLLGLAAKGASPAAQRVFEEQRRTLEGGEASPLDIFATTRALRAAYESEQSGARRAAEDTSRSALERLLAGAQVGAGVIAENLTPIPGIGQAGAVAKAAAKVPGRYLARGANVVNRETGMIFRDTPSPSAAASVAEQLNTTPGFLQTAEQRVAQRATGLGGTGGRAPRPPGGPKFSGEQFPAKTQADLAAIQEQPRITGARPTVSLAEQQRMAGELRNVSTPDLIGRLEKIGRPGETSSAVLEMNNRVAGVIQATSQWRDLAAKGLATEADQAKMALAYQEALFGRAAAVRATSEAARTTGAQGRIPITARLSPKDAAIFDAIGDLAKKNPEEFAGISQRLAAVSGNPKKLGLMLRKMADDRTVWQKGEAAFFEYYRANVLWNPATHFTNTVSGLFQVGSFAAREVLKDPRSARYLPSLAAGYGKAALGLLPERAQQWLSAHAGVFDDLPDQLRLTGDPDRYLALRRGEIPGIVGEAVRLPFKALALGDVFQKKPLYNFALKIRAAEAGRARGLKGKALDDFVNDPPADIFNEIAESAFNDAIEFSLQSESVLSSAIEGFRNANPLFKLHILFVRTPTNLAIVGTRFSPLGLLRLAGEGGRASAKNVIAEATIGSGVTAGFLSLLGSDNMTGLTPRSQSERVLWEAEGRQPMSIRATEYPILNPLLKMVYGDRAATTWVPVYPMGPLLYPALIAAAAHEATRDGAEITPEHVVSASAAAGRTLLDTIPLFQAYRNVNDVLASGSVDLVTRYLSGVLRPLIPASTGLATIERLRDGFKRDPRNLEESLKMSIPGLGEQVRLDYDVLGRPIPIQAGAAGLLPRATTERPDEGGIVTEERRLRDANPFFHGLNKPSRTIGSGVRAIELSDDEYNTYERTAGESKQRALVSLIRSRKYLDATDAEKSRLFERAETEAQNAAQKALGIEIATSSKEIETVAKGARLAVTHGDRYERGKALASIGGSRLTPEVRTHIDAARSQPDPSKDDYDPTVTELLRGHELVAAWLRAPAFEIGNRAAWDRAARAAEQLRGLRRDAGRAGRNPLLDPNFVRFYTEGAGGWLPLLYTSAGAKRDEVVHRGRKAIQQDRLWGLFASSANAAERPPTP